MATAAGRPFHFEGSDFSHARVDVIPDSMQSIDRREAIARLMAGQDTIDGNSPARGPDLTRRTQ
jgi:hypothetical protein